MKTDRELLAQALDALEYLDGDGADQWKADVITALRERLAQPEQEQEQEPVAWLVYTLDGKSAFITDNPADFTPEHRALPLYTAPPQRRPLTEPEQEPVAWEVSEDGRIIQDNDFTHDVVLRVTGDFESDERRIAYVRAIVDKLNTAPPQHKEKA